MSKKGRKAFGTKEWEDDIYERVSTHGQIEGEILESYQELANDDDMSPAFRYLARLILEDEVRHHDIFDDLAASMKAQLDQDHDEQPIPTLRGFRADQVRIKAVTDELLQIEREDLRELKELSKRLKEFRTVSLWPFLIELMLDDTKKHIKILKFIRDRAEDQPD